MRDLFVALLGILVSVVGIVGFAVNYAVIRLGGVLEEMLDLKASPSTETGMGFVLLFISGVFLLFFSTAKSSGRRYRFWGFFATLSSGISMGIFFSKFVSLGPGWFGVETIGSGDSANMVKISMAVLALSLFTFITSFTALASEVR